MNSLGIAKIAKQMPSKVVNQEISTFEEIGIYQ
jgi:hypothetical protein